MLTGTYLTTEKKNKCICEGTGKIKKIFNTGKVL
jgi:hypothetical protein